MNRYLHTIKFYRTKSKKSLHNIVPDQKLTSLIYYLIVFNTKEIILNFHHRNKIRLRSKKWNIWANVHNKRNSITPNKMFAGIETK